MSTGELTPADVSVHQHPRNSGKGPVLTWKKARFVLLYLRYGNQRRAAIEAGCPPTGAHVTAHKWLRQQCVLDFMAKAQARRMEQLHIDATWALRELVALYHTSFADLLELEKGDDGTWRLGRKFDLNNAPPEVLARIEAMEIRPDGTIIVKLPPKLRTLETIGRHINVSAFEDRVVLEQRTAEQQVENINKGRERVAQMRLAKLEGETDAA